MAERYLTDEEKYDIIMSGDTSYDGVFYTGVKTTGIFCLPSCTARKPKRKNVVFLDTSEEALAIGLRPCKRCRPLDKEWWHKRMTRKTSESRHRSNHRSHFHSQRNHAIDKAVDLIMTTDREIIDIAYDCGFKTQSAFYDNFRKVCRCTPTQLRNASAILIRTPEPFSFDECLVYLDRSPLEILHTIRNEAMTKLIRIADSLLLITIQMGIGYLVVKVVNEVPAPKDRGDVQALVRQRVRHWFDLDTELSDFYHACDSDAVVGSLIKNYQGLRIIRMDDPFEAICWAILGQQINLTYAYTLKKRLVEAYGQSMVYNEQTYYTFPSPHSIASLDVDTIKAIGLTTKKSEYILDMARHFNTGEPQEFFRAHSTDYQGLHRYLMTFRGIGPWTADYVIMKCFSINEAFPLADVGIHNALKLQMNRTEKPSMDEIEIMLPGWKGWESYVAFYLWRRLYD